MPSIAIPATLVVGNERSRGNLDAPRRPQWRGLFRSRPSPALCRRRQYGREEMEGMFPGRPGSINRLRRISALDIGSGDGKVYCLDVSSGKPVWSTPTGNGIDSSPAVIS